jgi:hypothetical protein
MASRSGNRNASRKVRPLPPARADVRSLRVIPGGLDDPSDERPAWDPDDRYAWDDEPRQRRPARSDWDEEPAWDDEAEVREEAPPRRRGRSAAARAVLKVVVVVAVFATAAGLYAIMRSDDAPETPVATAASVSPLAAPSEGSPQSAVPTNPVATAALAEPRPPLPDVPGLVVLIRNVVVALAQANATANYSVLREIAAPDFQLANSPARLSDAFAALRARQLDLAAVTVVNPNLTQPAAIGEDGLLRLAGFFQAGAAAVEFDLAFQWNGGGWRLFAIGAKPQEAVGKPGDLGARVDQGPPEVPDAAALVMLIRSTVIALNQANITGNYSVLRELAAPNFQSANSFADLADIFAELRGRQIDLAPVAVIDPRLFRPAAIDGKGMLRLTGFFASRPEQVNFDLAYQKVEGDWRLFGIGLNTSREEPAPLAAPVQAGAAATAPAVEDAQPPSPPPVARASVPPEPRLRPLPRPEPLPDAGTAEAQPPLERPAAAGSEQQPLPPG